MSLGMCRPQPLFIYEAMMLLSKVSGMIYDYIQELQFHNFLCVYAYRNFNNTLPERSVTFSIS
jgi:hypothetical protein